MVAAATERSEATSSDQTSGLAIIRRTSVMLNRPTTVPSSSTTGNACCSRLGDDLDDPVKWRPRRDGDQFLFGVQDLTNREFLEHVHLKLADVGRRVDPGRDLGLVDATPRA